MPAKIVHTETAVTDAVETTADPAAVADSIDELRRRTSGGGPHIIEIFIEEDSAMGLARHSQNIIEDITHLHNRYGAKAFFFVDECVSPSILNALADGIIERKLDIRWSCYVRFEAKLADKAFCKKLSRSGLRMLYFGLESACQRIIDLMRKGNRKEKMAQILESTASAGILNMILYFVGFPSETRAEALETKSFLMDNRNSITFALAGQFLLEESSPVFDTPEQFGITEISPLSENSDLGIIYNYKTNSGLSNQAAEEIKDFINNETQVLHHLDFLNRSHLLLS